MRLGINGFGRIGRCIARLASASADIEIAAVNDLASDIANLAYLYNYDSTYGRSPLRAEADPARREIAIGGTTITFFSRASATDVPWEDAGVDILVDATGIAANVVADRELTAASRVKRVIVTHSPDSGVDRYLIMGVNDSAYDAEHDRVVSASICDANAIAHPLQALDAHYGIESGFVTTLHPWLSYQNLVDAPASWQSRPGLYWADFSLGRMSTGTLIPKNTTAVSVLRPVLPDLATKLAGFSYRTPTHIVCSADLTLRLSADTTADELLEFLSQNFQGSPYVGINFESLVGTDYLGDPHSAIIDAQWLNVIGGRMIKLVLWYDNEFGYSNRVIDIARMMARGPH
ncbi:MAG TPA: glyceraldehyde 3-phosphate dehydrogenase NAD-binding domain-containing protein [Alphaproteobacteria bacterium]|nr:glyceraldehyde 3-phosphate dehydrogenase NAD-binding domain-containing protein [Alphaproteobacteria bacterium]